MEVGRLMLMDKVKNLGKESNMFLVNINIKDHFNKVKNQVMVFWYNKVVQYILVIGLTDLSMEKEN